MAVTTKRAQWENPTWPRHVGSLFLRSSADVCNLHMIKDHRKSSEPCKGWSAVGLPSVGGRRVVVGRVGRWAGRRAGQRLVGHQPAAHQLIATLHGETNPPTNRPPAHQPPANPPTNQPTSTGQDRTASGSSTDSDDADGENTATISGSWARLRPVVFCGCFCDRGS